MILIVPTLRRGNALRLGVPALQGGRGASLQDSHAGAWELSIEVDRQLLADSVEKVGFLELPEY